jgi:nitroreductase
MDNAPHLVPREQILAGFNFRHAAKRFDSEKTVSNEDFELLLEVARLSPSSFGLEPWNIIIANVTVEPAW